MSKKLVRVGLTMMLIRDEKILLGKRINTETAEGMRAYPGGRMDFGEDPITGIIREVDEETGLKLDPKKIKFVDYKNEYFPEEDKHYVSLVFITSNFEGEPERKEPKKCAGWEWYDPFDLPEDTFWAVRETIEANKTFIKSFIANGRKCWLCGKGRANTVIETERETPGGKPCKSKEVMVHWGCYMDMNG